MYIVMYAHTQVAMKEYVYYATFKHIRTYMHNQISMYVELTK